MNNRYDGWWENGQRQGDGTFYYANGGTYQGQWQANKKHGRGIYTYDDGSVFDGEFVNDRMITPPGTAGTTGDSFGRKSASTSTAVRKALNIGGEDNPVRQCIDISDLHVFAQKDAREAYNMLLRYLGELRHMYSRYRSMMSGPNDDPFTMSMAQLWLFCRDCDLLSPQCPLARINRFFLGGPRQEINPVKMTFHTNPADDIDDGIQMEDPIAVEPRDGITSAYCRGESAKEVQFTHAPNKCLLFRHFLEGIPRIALARYTHEDFLEQMMERVLKDHILPHVNGWPTSNSETIFAFLVDEPIQGILAKHEEALWRLFKGISCGSASWGPNTGLTQAHHFNGSSHRAHINGRLDYTIRIKSVLHLLAKAQLLTSESPILPAGKASFQSPRKDEDSGLQKMVGNLKRLLSGEEETLAILARKKSTINPLGAESVAAETTPEGQTRAATPAPVGNEEDVCYVDFKITIMEALSIFAGTLSPSSRDKVCGILTEQQDPSDFVSLADYCDCELVFAEFQRFLLMMSDRAEKLEKLKELTCAQQLDGFLTYVFFPAIASGYPGPKVDIVEPILDAEVLPVEEAPIEEATPPAEETAEETPEGTATPGTQTPGERAQTPAISVAVERPALWVSPCKVYDLYPREIPSSYDAEVEAW